MDGERAIQLYRVDNPDGIWEYEDEAVRLHYRKMALEGGTALAGLEPATQRLPSNYALPPRSTN